MTFKDLARGRTMLGGVVVGAAYGILARVAVNVDALLPYFAVMTLAFLVLVPLSIGYLAVRPLARPSYWVRIFGPWLPVAVLLAVAAALGWEGSICILMASPILLVLASLGGLAGGAEAARRPVVVPIVVLLPYAFGPLEHRQPLPDRYGETVTTIDIDAPPERVWPLVASVDSIRPEEQRVALFTVMGFPKPVSATLSHPGVGGVRLARFQGGLVFDERVTEWVPNRRIAFTIRPNTDSIPPTTLDEHVKVGGPYFDVMTGSYELEPLSGGRTRLVLRSTHRVTTPVNFYAAWWTDRIMRSIQDNIMAIQKARAEGTARRR